MGFNFLKAKMLYFKDFPSDPLFYPHILIFFLCRVLKVFLSRTAQRIPYMTGGRVMRMLAVILLVVFWFLVGWTSSMCQNLERDILLVGQGKTSDHLTFNMCLTDRWDYMTAVGMWSLCALHDSLTHFSTASNLVY